MLVVIAMATASALTKLRDTGRHRNHSMARGAKASLQVSTERVQAAGDLAALSRAEGRFLTLSLGAVADGRDSFTRWGRYPETTTTFHTRTTPPPNSMQRQRRAGGATPRVSEGGPLRPQASFQPTFSSTHSRCSHTSGMLSDLRPALNNTRPSALKVQTRLS